METFKSNSLFLPVSHGGGDNFGEWLVLPLPLPPLRHCLKQKSIKLLFHKLGVGKMIFFHLNLNCLSLPSNGRLCNSTNRTKINNRSLQWGGKKWQHWFANFFRSTTKHSVLGGRYHSQCTASILGNIVLSGFFLKKTKIETPAVKEIKSDK